MTSHINVTINGRQYRMACEEGQEARLRQLAENFDRLSAKISELGVKRLCVYEKHRRIEL